MAKFQITGPDGARYEITAPDDATESDVINYAKSNFKTQQQPAKPDPDPVTAGEMATDVAKSAGIGVAQGALGLATLPGNVEALGRAGINAAAGMVGVKPVVDADTYLTNYGDLKKRVERHTGEFYQPKTTMGKYARTAGEFASLAIGGPASLAGKAARVGATALASEGAGQLTEGTAAEPWARVGGALVGGNLPNMARRAVTPAPADPVRAAAVQALEAEGVNALTAGQRTGNRAMRWVEDATATVPGGGGRATAMQTQAAEQFTAATLRRAGIQAPRATPDVLNTAFQNIGQEYQALGRITQVQATPNFGARVNTIANEYRGLTPESVRVPLVEAIANDLTAAARQGAQIPGNVYNSYHSQLRAAQRSQANNPEASRAIGRMVEALDAQMIRSVPAPDRARMTAYTRDLNTRYRNMLAIEKAAGGAGEQAAGGLISPAALKGAVKQQNARDYTRGRSELANLSRAGEQVMKPLPSSGTAERGMAQGVVSAPGSVVGYAAGGDPMTAIMGAVAPAVAKAGTARVIMNPLMQQYLGNQRIPQLPPVPDRRSVLPMLPYNALYGGQ